MPTPDPAIRDHKAWLGYVQQEGLVVSPAALVDAQVVLDRNTLPMQERFLPFVKEVALDGEDPVPAITDFPAFARGFLRWPDGCLHGLDPARPLPDALTISVQDGESIAPSFALRDPRTAAQPLTADRSPLATSDWLLLGQSLPLATDLDARTAADERAWSASPTQRLERLLRETRVPIGLLTNGTQIRLVYAPHGESAGSITFTVRHMTEVAGRPILAALHMLLGECCSPAAPSTARLPALLARSREYQSTVSTQLAGQVLDALYELLRGFQAADERAKGELLRSVLARNPNDVYSGLLTVLMRLVFLLFAEDRGIVPTDPKTKRATGLYVRNYSVHGLFERLRADAERYPDTMDQRYGAWAQLLALFRVIHDGCRHPQMRMPPRRGNLFDPDRFRFLEGRERKSEIRSPKFEGSPNPEARSHPSPAGFPSPSPLGGERAADGANDPVSPSNSSSATGREQPLAAGTALRTSNFDAPSNFEPRTSDFPIPLVSDGAIHSVLQNLLLLDGERLSYRTLDVEEIGSVYQTVMGFRLEIAAGPSIAIKGQAKKGSVPAATVINLDALLAMTGKDRPKWLAENTDQELTGQAANELRDARSLDGLLAALERKIARNATPSPVARGGLILQPTDERRRSGSHYTPRAFTQPIVRKTLAPILRRLAEKASSEQRAASSGPPAPLTVPGSPPTLPAYGDSIVSGSGSVAARHEPGGSRVASEPVVPQGGALRADQPSAPGSQLHPGQSGGGMGAAGTEGVPPVPPHRPRQSAGIGDPSPAGTPSVAGLRGPGEAVATGSLDSRPATDRAGTEPSAAGLAGRSPLTTDCSLAPPPLAADRSPLAPPPPEAILALKICDLAVGSAAFLVETCRQLAEELLKAWRYHGGRPAIPPDETEELFAMRLIAQRCLYGVDRNPMAVDLAKLSLWLATLAKDHPFTFLDHAIRCGDSLVGLTRRQIETFSWKTEFTTGQLWEPEVRRRTAAALRERQNLLGMGDDYGTPQLKREKLEKADELLDLVRFIGDAAIAAFFSADKDKAREAKRVELAERIATYLRTGDVRLRPTAEVKELRGEASSEQRAASGVVGPAARRSPLTAHPIRPFHWEIEFPEVFERENPGFDAFVGNPPFAGSITLHESSHPVYTDFLRCSTAETGGKCDLVAFFFRRAFSLSRADGCYGLIATNTIGQGDTRASGLRWICVNGGTIYAARKRYNWPGQAAVVVSIVWIAKPTVPLNPPFDLDGRPVQQITAYLFHAGGHDDPATLIRNRRRAFVGVKIYGQGFLFSDDPADGNVTPTAEMRRLLAADARNQAVVKPYIGGEEINESPTQANRRFVIDFGDKTEQEARTWREVMEILENKVRPGRMALTTQASAEKLKNFWWQYYHPARDLYAAIASTDTSLVCSQTSKYLCFAFLPSGWVFGQKAVVIAFDSKSAFCVLQSRVHTEWAEFMGSSMKDDPVYTSSVCFETFPFPAGWETNAALEAAGLEYYEFRAALMVDLWLGLTETYNLFHAPDEEALARLEALYAKRVANGEWRVAEKVPADRSPLSVYRSPAAALDGIRQLRKLHAAMDAAVLAAYGWLGEDGETLRPGDGETGPPLPLRCEFLLDYEDEEEASSEQSAASGAGDSPLTARRSPLTGRTRKRPWRYRWPDEVRDEILARLLKLNAERAQEEKLAGLAAAAAAPAKTRKPRARKSATLALQGELIPPPQGELFG